MLNQLNERERVFVFAGILIILLMTMYLIISKAFDMRKGLSEQVNETIAQSTQLDRIIVDFNYFKGLKTGGQDEDVSQMYSKLDQIMIRYNLKEKVSTMKDSTNTIRKDYNQITIDVSFRSVFLNDIIKLIYDIEKNKQINAKVDYLDFRKPFQDKEAYDVNLKISSFKRIGKGGT
jgi:general secretion pathway protein M